MLRGNTTSHLSVGLEIVQVKIKRRHGTDLSTPGCLHNEPSTLNSVHVGNVDNCRWDGIMGTIVLWFYVKGHLTFVHD